MSSNKRRTDVAENQTSTKKLRVEAGAGSDGGMNLEKGMEVDLFLVIEGKPTLVGYGSVVNVDGVQHFQKRVGENGEDLISVNLKGVVDGKPGDHPLVYPWYGPAEELPVSLRKAVYNVLSWDRVMVRPKKVTASEEEKAGGRSAKTAQKAVPKVVTKTTAAAVRARGHNSPSTRSVDDAAQNTTAARKATVLKPSAGNATGKAPVVKPRAEKATVRRSTEEDEADAAGRTGPAQSAAATASTDEVPVVSKSGSVLSPAARDAGTVSVVHAGSSAVPHAGKERDDINTQDAEAVLGVIDTAAISEDNVGLRDVREFSERNYDCEHCVASVDQLKRSHVTYRSLDESRKAELKASLRDGFKQSISHIHIYAEASLCGKSEDIVSSDFIDEQRRLRHGSNPVLDGQHRLACCQELVAQGVEASKFAEIPCVLWIRKDGRRMRDFEVLQLMAHLAERLKTQDYSFMDSIHAVVSHASVYHSERRAAIEASKTPGESSRTVGSDKSELGVFALRLQKSKGVGASSRSSSAVYARIGLFFEKNGALYKAFRETQRRVPAIGLTHLSCSQLYEMPTTFFTVAMDCLAAFIEARSTGVASPGWKKGGQRARMGPFKEYGNIFFNLIRGVCISLDHEAKKQNVDFGLVMDEVTLPSRTTEGITLRRGLSNTMASFDGTKRFQAELERVTTRFVRLIESKYEVEVVSVAVAPARAKTSKRRSSSRASGYRGKRGNVDDQDDGADVAQRRSSRLQRSPGVGSAAAEAGADRAVGDKRVTSARNSRSTSEQVVALDSDVDDDHRRGEHARAGEDRVARSSSSSSSNSNSNSNSNSHSSSSSSSSDDDQEDDNEKETEKEKEKEDDNEKETEKEKENEKEKEKENETEKDGGAGSEDDVPPFDDKVPDATACIGIVQETTPTIAEAALCERGDFFRMPACILNVANIPRARNKHLQAMGVPAKHRSHLVLKTNDLVGMSEALDCHAAYAQMAVFLSHTRALRHAQRSPYVGLPSANPASGQLDSASGGYRASLVRALATDRTQGVGYFEARRTELNERGYTLLEGVLRDTAFKDALGEYEEAAVPVDEVFQHAKDVFDAAGREEAADRAVLAGKKKKKNTKKDKTNENTSGKGDDDGEIDLTNPSHLWCILLNRDEREDLMQHEKNRATRYISHRKMFFEMIENDPAKQGLVRYKALLDARVAMIGLKLGVTTGSGTKCMIPASGGRMLVSPPYCRRQVFHVDYDVQALRGKDAKCPPNNPGGFALCTGDKEDWLWIVPRSHYGLQRSFVEGKDCGPAYEAEKISIPAYSVVVVRGDCVHAGSETPGNGETGFRYHVAFVPDGVTVTNSIHLSSEFKHK